MDFDSDTADTVWNALVEGIALPRGSVPASNGRMVLRNLFLPEPQVESRGVLAGLTIKQRQPVSVVRGRRWDSIEFHGGRLSNIRFESTELTSCDFDDCIAKNWRIFSSRFSNCVFESVDFSKSAFSSLGEDDFTSFESCRFIRCNFGGTAYKNVRFSSCDFNQCKLASIDFRSTAFSKCRFVGTLRDVIFYGTVGGSGQINEMRDVDFANARLRFVEFRSLNLDSVTFPNGEQHIIIKDCKHALDLMISTLSKNQGLPDQQLKAYLSSFRKWLGPRQERCLVNTDDLCEIGGESCERIFLELHKAVAG